MKICFIGDAGHVNLISWAKGFSHRGHDVSIVTFNRECEKCKDVAIYKLNSPQIGKLRYLWAIPEIRRYINHIHPDIIVGYRMNSYGIMAVQSGFHPVVVIAQGSDIFYPGDPKINRYMLKYVSSKADLVHVWGSHMLAKLLEYGVDSRKIFVLPKGIDTQVFKPLSQNKQRKSNVIISTRQLRESYNHACLLNAMVLVAEKVKDAQCIFCGNGEYKNRLKKMCKELKIEGNVEFIGRREHSDVAILLANSDVYVSMQPTDGVSASLLEAMACGAFPIVPDIAANRIWVQHGINGFLVPPNDHVSLASFIITAIQSDEMRKAARKVNRDHLHEKASMERNIEETEKVYQALTSKYPNK